MRNSRILAIVATAAMTTTASGCGADSAPTPTPSFVTPPPYSISTTIGVPPTTGPTSESTVDIPNVVGRRLSEAQAELQASGFRSINPVDATGQGRTVMEPNNWIVQEQSPAAGTAAAPSEEVTLRVRKPTDTTATRNAAARGTVPDVLCLDLQSAQTELRRAGFFALWSEDASGEGRPRMVDRNWVVIGQSARAGQSADPTTVIVLTVVKFGEPTGASGCPS